MVLIYSLSKVIERKQGKLNYTLTLNLLRNAKKDLEEDDLGDYRKNIRKIFDFISSIDSETKLYISEIINQAQIRKGTKIYAHGISLARAAEILGISQWELMSYIGRTYLTNVSGGISVKERLSYARGLFK